MKVAKIFENGRSQAVRLPKESKWNSLFESLDMFTNDYMEMRNQGESEKRDLLWCIC